MMKETVLWNASGNETNEAAVKASRAAHYFKRLGELAEQTD